MHKNNLSTILLVNGTMQYKTRLNIAYICQSFTTPTFKLIFFYEIL